MVSPFQVPGGAVAISDEVSLTEFLERLRSMGKRIDPTGDGFMAQCPAHPDNRPSLQVKRGNTRQIILHCFAGCQPNEIMKSAGFKGFQK